MTPLSFMRSPAFMFLVAYTTGSAYRHAVDGHWPATIAFLIAALVFAIAGDAYIRDLDSIEEPSP